MLNAAVAKVLLEIDNYSTLGVVLSVLLISVFLGGDG